MKRIVLIVVILSCICGLVGCGKQVNVMPKEPEIEQIRAICNLATLECYYHNVAKSKKTGEGWFQVDRTFWVEYTGTVKLGVDMGKVTMELQGDDVVVIIPEAEIMQISIDKESLSEDSYITSADGFWLGSNKITAEDQTKAIESAQKEMEETVKSNGQLLRNAQDRAKELIENYIKQLASISDKQYNVIWRSTEESVIQP